MRMHRRSVLLGGAGIVGLALLAGTSLTPAAEAFEVVKSEAEWRRILTPEQFQVLRQHATERPFTSPLDKEHRPGVYSCAGCDLPLYRAEAKFDSRTGWPSFTASIDDAVGTSRDFSLLLPRTEVHCRRCGGHLGHIFDDGPPPTGKRHCINGAALKFMPASGARSGKRRP